MGNCAHTVRVRRIFLVPDRYDSLMAAIRPAKNVHCARLAVRTRAAVVVQREELAGSRGGLTWCHLQQLVQQPHWDRLLLLLLLLKLLLMLWWPLLLDDVDVLLLWR